MSHANPTPPSDDTPPEGLRRRHRRASRPQGYTAGEGKDATAPLSNAEQPATEPAVEQPAEPTRPTNGPAAPEAAAPAPTDSEPPAREAAAEAPATTGGDTQRNRRRTRTRRSESFDSTEALRLSLADQGRFLTRRELRALREQHEAELRRERGESAAEGASAPSETVAGQVSSPTSDAKPAATAEGQRETAEIDRQSAENQRETTEIEPEITSVLAREATSADATSLGEVTPEAAAPEVAAPEAAAHEAAVPSVAAPEVAAPEVAAREVAVTETAAPSVAAPEIAGRANGAATQPVERTEPDDIDENQLEAPAPRRSPTDQLSRGALDFYARTLGQSPVDAQTEPTGGERGGAGAEADSAGGAALSPIEGEGDAPGAPSRPDPYTTPATEFGSLLPSWHAGDDYRPQRRRGGAGAAIDEPNVLESVAGQLPSGEAPEVPPRGDTELATGELGTVGDAGERARLADEDARVRTADATPPAPAAEPQLQPQGIAQTPVATRSGNTLFLDDDASRDWFSPHALPTAPKASREHSLSADLAETGGHSRNALDSYRIDRDDEEVFDPSDSAFDPHTTRPVSAVKAVSSSAHAGRVPNVVPAQRKQSGDDRRKWFIIVGGAAGLVALGLIAWLVVSLLP